MIPAAFEYAKASSVEEAVKLLGKYGEDAKVLAGGHSLIPLMRLRLAQPKALVDINGIKELDHIKEDGSKLRIGALTRHVTLQNSNVVKDKLPLLAEVAGEVGDNQVRNMGTIGGVVAHADAAGDYPTIALMLDAEIVTNRRTIAAKDFFTDIFTTPLEADEIAQVHQVSASPLRLGDRRSGGPEDEWWLAHRADQRGLDSSARESRRGGSPKGRQAGGGGAAGIRRVEPVRGPAREPGIQETPREGAHQEGDRAGRIAGRHTGVGAPAALTQRGR